ncbi:MAG: hypothetical protein EON57_13095 [Alphaproteobacteria bacterium]|nr:MAG: hypothetical protein EON57_13095 [Alphaproteobacteria bacterium]
MVDSFSFWLVTAPMWAVAAMIFGGMIIAMLVALRLRIYSGRGRADDPGGTEKENYQQSVLVSAVMGLLALLIGFTFSLAINRFDTRRENVVLEANAIGTTYLRTQMLEEPHRTRLSKLLVDYTDVRIAAALTDPGPELSALMRKSDQLNARLWVATVAAFPSMRPNAFSHSYLEAMNALIDADTIRKSGRRSHVPGIVFLVLFLYQFMTAGVLSFALTGRGSRMTAILLFVLFGSVLLLVVDLDRATSGGITENQRAMLDVQAFMKAQPPASFDALVAPAHRLTSEEDQM